MTVTSAPGPLAPRAGGQAGQPGPAHQQADGVMPDRDALAVDQLGVHPRSAVGSPRYPVDRADQVHQPGMPDRPWRRRPSGPVVVSRARYSQRVAAAPDPHPVTAQLGDQAVALFWGHHRLHCGRCLAEDLHFFFQVADPLPRRVQLGAFCCRGPGLQAEIDQIAVPPPVQA